MPYEKMEITGSNIMSTTFHNTVTDEIVAQEFMVERITYDKGQNDMVIFNGDGGKSILVGVAISADLLSLLQDTLLLNGGALTVVSAAKPHDHH